MLRLIATAALVTAAGVAWLIYRTETLMATKDEILAQIADVKAVLLETGKDVNRVADKLDAAVANGNLTEVADAVAELKSIAQGIDDRAEASDPETTETPADETPAEPTA